MKNMFKKTLYMVVFLTLSGICHADIKQENDQIIKAAHSSGSLVFATPPYWGRENTQAGFEQLANHLERVINDAVASGNPASVVAAGNRIPDETINRIIRALELVPTSVTNVKEAVYIGFKVLSDESYDQFRRVMELTE